MCRVSCGMCGLCCAHWLLVNTQLVETLKAIHEDMQEQKKERQLLMQKLEELKVGEGTRHTDCVYSQSPDPDIRLKWTV